MVSLTAGKVVVGTVEGLDVDGAMKVRVVVVDVEPSMVDDGTVVGAGAAAGAGDEALVESPGPHAPTNEARTSIATTEVTLRTSTSGGSAVPRESVGLRAANRNPSARWT